MTGQQTKSGSLGGVPAALSNLLNAQMKLGSDLFEALTGQSLPNVNDVLRTVQGTVRKRTSGGCCEIPPPCWLPQSLGECTSHVGQCNNACIEITVTNCDGQARAVTVEAGKDPAVSVTPASLNLGPFERGTIRVCYDVPKDAPDGSHEIMVWVHGCREHYLRWTVSVGTVGMDSCHTITVDDCPDYLHHWYDHFYCGRRCSAAQTTPGIAANG